MFRRYRNKLYCIVLIRKLACTPPLISWLLIEHNKKGAHLSTKTRKMCVFIKYHYYTTPKISKPCYPQQSQFKCQGVGALQGGENQDKLEFPRCAD